MPRFGKRKRRRNGAKPKRVRFSDHNKSKVDVTRSTGAGNSTINSPTSVADTRLVEPAATDLRVNILQNVAMMAVCAGDEQLFCKPVAVVDSNANPSAAPVGGAGARVEVEADAKAKEHAICKVISELSARSVATHVVKMGVEGFEAWFKSRVTVTTASADKVCCLAKESLDAVNAVSPALAFSKYGQYEDGDTSAIDADARFAKILEGSGIPG